MVDLPHATSASAAIREHVRTAPDRTAVIIVEDVERDDGATQWSYRQLDAEARRIGAWLQSRFPAGDRVLLLYPTGLDFAAAFVGCLYAGMIAVPAPLPGRYRHEQLRVSGIANNAKVSATLTDTDNLAAVRDWAAADGLADLPVLATDSGDLPDADSWSPAESSRDQLAMLQYTSGATGEPKGAMLTHGNILSNVETQRLVSRLTTETRVGGWLPLYHDMGLLGLLLPALVVGTTCVLMRPAAFLKRPHHWLTLIDKYDIYSSAASSFAYEACAARITDEQVAALDLSRWRFTATGSEPIEAPALTAFQKRLAPAGLRPDVIVPCYGMAEATVYLTGDGFRELVVTTVDEGLLRHHWFVPATVGADLVSCGKPRYCEVLIAHPQTGEPLPPGAVGEIWLRGGSVAKSYWRNDSANERGFTPEGYLRTGDLGTLHDGELYVTGRIDELLVVHGRDLYPQDIERELRARHPELGAVGAAFTVPLAGDGTEEIMVVTHEINGRPAEDRLRQLAFEIKQTVAREFGVRLAGVGLLRRGGVRRTTSGKIQRATMRELFLAGELNAMYIEHEQPLADALRSRRLEPAGV